MAVSVIRVGVDSAELVAENERLVMELRDARIQIEDRGNSYAAMKADRDAAVAALATRATLRSLEVELLDATRAELDETGNRLAAIAISLIRVAVCPPESTVHDALVLDICRAAVDHSTVAAAEVPA